MNWLRLLGLIIPLTITRQWLYFTTTLSTSIFILLPISILTYTQYYKTLIPLDSSPHQQLTFTSINSSYVSNTIHSSFHNFKYDADLIYSLNMDLEVACSNMARPSKITYSLNSKSFHESISSGSFILYCDKERLYSANNRFVPYNLRYFVPPILTSLSSSRHFSLTLSKFKGSHLTREDWELVVQMEKTWDYIIDDNLSSVRFDVEWIGFRYYLVRYYYTCLVIGTLVFFILSGGVSIVTSYGILLISHNRRMKRDKSVNNS